MRPARSARFGQIGDRARHAQHAVVAAGAQRELRERARHERPSRPRSSVERARSARPWSRAFSRAVARHLTAARGGRRGRESPRTIRRAARPAAPAAGTAATRDREIEPIAQRSGQARRVARDLRRRTAAGADRVAEEPARTRVHRADQHEPRGEDRRARRPRDSDRALLERLAQHFEHVPAELGHLVEEQHAVVREADLAGTRMLSAADERDVRDRVMRRAERPLRQQAACRSAGARRPSGWTSPRAPPRTSAAGGWPPLAWPSSSCRRPAGRPSARCGRRRRRSRAPAAPAPGRARPRSRRRTPSRRGAATGGTAAGDARNATGSFSADDRFGERADGIELEAFDDGGFAAVGMGQQQRRDSDARRAAAAIGSTPRAVWMPPSSDSSPSSRMSAMSRRVMCPAAARTPSAIGRSNDEPALRMSAGARFTVTRCGGNSNPEFRIALRTRSRLSRTLASGKSDHLKRRQAERDVDFDLHRDRPRSRTPRRSARRQASAMSDASGRTQIGFWPEIRVESRRCERSADVAAISADGRRGARRFRQRVGDGGSLSCREAIFSRVPGAMRFDVQPVQALDLGDGRVEELRDRRRACRRA